MSKKKNKKKALENAQVNMQPQTEEVVETETAEEAPVVEKKPNDFNYAYWVTSLFNTYRVFAAVELDPQDPTKAIELIDIRAPWYPEVRVSDLTEDDIKSILSRPVGEYDSIRYGTKSDAVDFMKAVFNREMDSWRKRYGSVDAARKIKLGGMLDNFRREGKSA